MNQGKKIGILPVIAPGLLVAATGVGAGDLATAALAFFTWILWSALRGE